MSHSAVLETLRTSQDDLGSSFALPEETIIGKVDVNIEPVVDVGDANNVIPVMEERPQAHAVQ
jgi:hypothetical protein